MLTHRRWAIQIMRDILQHLAALEGLSKGQIRIILGLNFYQAQSYVDFLAERAYVTELDGSSASPGGPLLRITAKGKEVLSLIDGLLSFMGLNDAEELPENSPMSSTWNVEAKRVRVLS